MNWIEFAKKHKHAVTIKSALIILLSNKYKRFLYEVNTIL
jgi:hypothetical protein